MNDNDFNPFHFNKSNEGETPDKKEGREATARYGDVFGGVLWAVSMFLTASYNFVYLTPMFSPLLLFLMPKEWANFLGGVLAAVLGLVALDIPAILWENKLAHAVAVTQDQRRTAAKASRASLWGAMLINAAAVIFFLGSSLFTFPQIIISITAVLACAMTFTLFGMNIGWRRKFNAQSQEQVLADTVANTEAKRLAEVQKVDAELQTAQLQLYKKQQQNKIKALTLTYSRVEEGLEEIAQKAAEKGKSQILRVAQETFGLTDEAPTVTAATSPTGQDAPRMVAKEERDEGVNFPQPR